MDEKFSIISDSEENTQIIARKIAPIFRSGDILILDGDLGAGKTCFVKGFTEGLHSGDVVNSPTFSIANFYRTEKQSDLLHIDLYRIESVDEFNDLGLLDYFEQSIVLIEWGKKYREIFDSYLLISFQIDDDNIRTLTFEYQGYKYDSVMNKLKKILEGGDLC